MQELLHAHQRLSSWPDWCAEVVTMTRGDTDATDETGATDRSSSEPELQSQRAAMNFVTDLGWPRATSHPYHPFVIVAGDAMRGGRTKESLPCFSVFRRVRFTQPTTVAA